MSQNDSPDRLRRKFLLDSAALSGWSLSLAACGGGGAASLSEAAPAPGTPSAPPTPAPVISPPPASAVPASPPLDAPAWSTSLATNAWTTLPGTAFLPWAKANIPAGRYYGTAPFEAIVNAYCDPANDAARGAQYFYGGGHGDGSCNAVCKFDQATLTWSLVGAPTPPSVYLADYPLSKLYPSGVAFNGWFLSRNELTDARDLPFAAPALARVSTHMYAAAVKRGTRIHYFYLSYGEFDTETGEWMGREVDLGAQLIKFRPQYGAAPLQQGTVAVYDEVTDRIFITLNPGDAGGSWRSAIMVFNPQTRAIESVFESGPASYGLIADSMNVCRVGRDLFYFTKIGRYGEPTLMNQGFVFNMDSKTFKRFVLTGDTEGSTFAFSNTQETIPSFYDGAAIRRWNYQPSERARIYSVDPLPVSGSGSTTDPLVLRQTVRTIGGAIPARPLYVYSRLMYHAGARCALLLPEAGADWVALKLG